MFPGGLFPELRGGGVSPVRDGLPEMRGGGDSFDSPVRGSARAEMRAERAERSRTPPSGLSSVDMDAVLAFLASPSVLASCAAQVDGQRGAHERGVGRGHDARAQGLVEGEEGRAREGGAVQRQAVRVPGDAPSATSDRLHQAARGSAQACLKQASRQTVLPRRSANI